MRRVASGLVLLGLLFPAQAAAWTWPVDGPVLRGFSFDAAHPYAAGQHRGIAIGAPTGTAVVAPASGVVSFAGSVPTNGLSVTIRTVDGYSVTLVHLGSLGVRAGVSVAEGDVAGTIGPSGTPELAVPYVYLGVRRTNDPNGYLDPLAFLPPRPASPPAPPPTLGGSEPLPAPAAPAPPAAAPAPEPPPAPAAPAPPANEPLPPAAAPAEPVAAAPLAAPTSPEPSPVALPTPAPVPVPAPAAEAPAAPAAAPAAPAPDPVPPAAGPQAPEAAPAPAPAPPAQAPEPPVPPVSPVADEPVPDPAPPVPAPTAPGADPTAPVDVPRPVDPAPLPPAPDDPVVAPRPRRAAGRGPAGPGAGRGTAARPLACAACRDVARQGGRAARVERDRSCRTRPSAGAASFGRAAESLGAGPPTRERAVRAARRERPGAARPARPTRRRGSGAASPQLSAPVPVGVAARRGGRSGAPRQGPLAHPSYH